MFPHVIRSLLVIAALMPCLAWAGDDDEIAQGRQIAEDNCARCHAIGPEGDSPYEPAPPFRTLSEKWPPSYLAEALAEGIVVGHPEMPEFSFAEPDIDALIAYLESLNPS